MKFLVLLSLILTLVRSISIDIPENRTDFELYKNRKLKILIWPAEWSHWINMKIIIKHLHQTRNHQFTVIRPDLYADFIALDDPAFDVIQLSTPNYGPDFHHTELKKILEIFKVGDYDYNLLYKMKSMINFWKIHILQRSETCDLLFQNSKILSSLRAENFDLILSDPCVICSEMLAKYLDIPLIYSVRMLPGEFQQTLTGAPFHPSYIPVINTEYTDEMNLMQRSVNLINFTFQQSAVAIGSYFFADPLVAKHLSNYTTSGTTSRDLQSAANFWLIRLDFTFEFPRPSMPNTRYIGGYHAKGGDWENLDVDLLEFIDSAPKGVIVFSMGSMVDQIGPKRCQTLLKALNEIHPDYKIIWRYNTPIKTEKILTKPWLPQNDLLSHPKVKLFMTHAGTNGLYEAIYHGVPVLGLPMLVDQFDNMVRIERWKAGKRIDISQIKTNQDSQKLSQNINCVLGETKNLSHQICDPAINYQENMHKLSNLYRYRLNDPFNTWKIGIFLFLVT